MREDVRFPSRDGECAAWLFTPQGGDAEAPAPAIVMAHGFSGVKEQHLDRFADVFSAAGFAVLAFDYRFLGASDGEPRQQIFPSEQHEDYRNAVSWMAARPDVDSDRIGLWGSSYSGGHVLWLSAFEPRIRCVVAQVPAVDNLATITRLSGREGLDGMRALLAADRTARYAGGPVNYFPVVGATGDMALMADDEAKAWFEETGVALAPGWRNEVSIESLEKFLEYNPTGAIEYAAPTAVCVIAAEHDSLIPIELVEQAVARAGEPKRLVKLACGHFDLYDTEPWFSEASGVALDWFRRFLAPA